MKKIAVCGKGGSGKSTLVVLLAKGISKRGYRVLVIDSDESNPSLYRMLGLDHSPKPIMDMIGGRQGFKEKKYSATSNIQLQSKTDVLMQDKITVAGIPSENMANKDNIFLVSTGKILHALEGCACPMGILSREFLQKLWLDDNELAIIDMEAGIEHFGRGVEASVDGVLIVVEPSFESLELADRLNKLAAEIGVTKCCAVLNRIPTLEMASSLTAELKRRNVTAIGFIHYDRDIFEACLEGHQVISNAALDDLERFLTILIE